MNEFIEKLIDKLGDEYLSQDMRDWNNAILRAVEIVYQLAEEYVPEINVGKWIPCSERLPDDFMSFEYLTIRKGQTLATITYFCAANHKWYSNRKSTKEIEVIAWQPLPEPYKPEQQKEMPTDHFTERFNRVL